MAFTNTIPDRKDKARPSSVLRRALPITSTVDQITQSLASILGRIDDIAVAPRPQGEPDRLSDRVLDESKLPSAIQTLAPPGWLLWTLEYTA